MIVMARTELAIKRTPVAVVIKCRANLANPPAAVIKRIFSKAPRTQAA